MFSDADWLDYEERVVAKVVEPGPEAKPKPVEPVAEVKPLPPPADPPVVPQKSDGPSGAVLAVAGFSVLGGVAALVGASSIYGDWESTKADPSVTRAQAQGIIRTNHTLIIVGTGLTAGGLGLGAITLTGTF